MNRKSGTTELVLVEDPADLRQVFALRYRAYRSVGAIDPTHDRIFTDGYDRRDGVFVFALRQHRRFIASLRILLSDSLLARGQGYSNLTADRAFGDVLQSAFGPSGRLIEANRFVVDTEIRRLQLAQHVQLFRSLAIICLNFGAEFYVGAVRSDHLRFYRRLLCMRPLSDERPYPGLDVAMALMGGSFGSGYRDVCRRWGDAFHLPDAELATWSRQLERKAVAAC